MTSQVSSPKTVLITGASRGIGLLTAKSLLTKGYHVFAGMRAPETRNQKAASELQELANTNRSKLTILDLDVASDESVERAVAIALSYGQLDALVNNAGVMPVGITEAFTMTQIKDLFEVNVYGVARTARAVLPAMRQNGSGIIINLSSAAGRLSLPFFGIYCSSKWAMESYVETLNIELEGSGVEAVIVQPSAHRTDLVATSPAPNDTDRATAYGTMSEGGDRMLGMFQSAFDQNADINDAQNVADAIQRLIEQDGPRPVRTVVGEDMGVDGINQAVAPFQNGLIDELKTVYAPA
ncbi:SDR family oxidoreductase [Ponticaulis koreensis]|uniref:SDR family oxidoreductase n=1 Tax=Ponticaulis koreensis TaxID=1123045 RepID=UPI0003B36D5B|nr:SDR family oxidoreductase [Ponticaulis koreensis]